MSELELHIERKIPFVLYSTKEGESVVVFPAEKRITGSGVSAVMKDEDSFKIELSIIMGKFENFQSLRPSR